LPPLSEREDIGFYYMLMMDLNFKYKELLNYFKYKIPFKPELAIILGSGLGDFARSVNTKKTFSASSIPSYPKSTIEGHAGKIHFSKYEGKKLLLFQGRIHLYEGYKIYECILPVFISYKLGCKKILLTNAAGSVNLNFHPGDLMLTDSFNGINIKKELTNLIGLAGVEEKNRFLDFPSEQFNKIIKSAALKEKIDLKQGVYFYSKGPSYETPAEIRMTRLFGGDAAGMSTVHEAMFASYLGMETSAISCITNYGAGITEKKLSHSDVTETANLVKEKFERMVKRIISLV
jgi:purine-nucleoside phosphorylase